MSPLTVLLLALAACSPSGGDPPPTTCTSAADCGEGQLCVDSRCVADSPMRDAGRRDGGERADAGPGVDAGGPECVADGDCGGGVCVGGSCCEAADRVCGAACCVGAEVCFANACIVPGEACIGTSDCDEGHYCEPSLGPGGGPPPGGGEEMCAETRPGRCLPLPPRCEEPGADPATCIQACEFRPEAGVLDVALQWRWDGSDLEVPSNHVDVWSTPAVGRLYDTNCDGSVDVLDPPNVVFVSGASAPTQCAAVSPSACRRGVLRLLDGQTGRTLWSLDRPSPGSIGFMGFSLAIGDVVGDDRLEIVTASGEGNLVVVDGEGTVLMTSTEALAGSGHGNFGWGGALSIGDMNGDGAPEIAYAAQVFTTAGGALSQVFAGEQGVGGPDRWYAISALADLGETPDLELVAGRTAYRFDGSAMWHRNDLADGYPALGDLDGDGAPEVVLVSAGRVYVLEGSDGTTELGPTTLPGSGRGGPPTVADFDGDGRVEIGVATDRFYVMLKPDYAGGQLPVVWQAPNHDLSSSVTGSTVFDFEGDGVAEVVYNDECFLWVYDGPTGDIRFATPTTSFTANEASLVADVDGDGHAEILMGSNGANPGPGGWGCDVAPWNAPDPTSVRPAWAPPAGAPSFRGVSLLRDAANSWVATRTVWNQHTYHVSNVCSDRDDACVPAGPHGAIPPRERANWRVPWLNNFRQNVQGEALFGAPDATVNLAVECTEPPTLVAAVRNRGEALLPPGVVVAFYALRGGAEVEVARAATVGPIFPGRVEEVTATPAGADLGETFLARVVIDPAARTFQECREDNNASEPVQAICIM